MKKFLLLCVMAFFALGMASTASAVSVSVTYTGDNVIGSWYQDGAAPVNLLLGSNAADWTIADTSVLDLAAGDTYQIVWQVSNFDGPGSGNPAGFLAEIEFGGSTIVSSSAFQWGTGGSTGDFNDTNWNWTGTTEWGINDGSSNIWTDNNSGPIATIDSDARWIWSADNFDSTTTQNLFIKAEFEIPQTAPVPEPATMLLVGAGLLGLAGFRRKFKK